MRPLTTESASYYPGNVGQLNVATGAAPRAETRDTIQRALDEQEKIAVGLHELATALEDRLSLVLTSAKPDSAGAGVAPTPVSILDRVRANTDRVAAFGYRLNDILNRVQL